MCSDYIKVIKVIFMFLFFSCFFFFLLICVKNAQQILDEFWCGCHVFVNMHYFLRAVNILREKQKKSRNKQNMLKVQQKKSSNYPKRNTSRVSVKWFIYLFINWDPDSNF